MTPVRLIEKLSAEVAEVLKDFKLQAENQGDKKISVYSQYIPVDRFEQDTFYPFVLVTLTRVEDEVRSSKATIVLVIGVYGGDKDEGWRDLLNVAERLRQYLLTIPAVGGEFLLNKPITFEPLDEQPEPFLIGRIETQFYIGQKVYSIK